MQRRNNSIIGHILAVIAFLVAIPMPWFMLRHPTIGGHSFPIFDSLTVTGANGSLRIAQVMPNLPIWLLLAASTIATTIGALNRLGVSSISKALLILVHLFAAAYYLSPLLLNLFHPGHLDVKAGPIVALAATYLAIRLSFGRIADEPAPTDTPAPAASS